VQRFHVRDISVDDGVAMVSRLLKIIGLFCKRALQKRPIFCKRLCTGWRRPIGCLKLQIIFRQRAVNYWALLRKMKYKDKASYGSSQPWIFTAMYMITGLY